MRIENFATTAKLSGLNFSLSHDTKLVRDELKSIYENNAAKIRDEILMAARRYNQTTEMPATIEPKLYLIDYNNQKILLWKVEGFKSGTATYDFSDALLLDGEGKVTDEEIKYAVKLAQVKNDAEDFKMLASTRKDANGTPISYEFKLKQGVDY